MIEKKDVEKLANLARIDIADDEKEVLQKDLKAILSYVSEVQDVVTGEVTPEAGRLRNVMREDGDPHEVGAYTGDILAEAPETQDGYVKVKKIL